MGREGRLAGIRVSDPTNQAIGTFYAWMSACLGMPSRCLQRFPVPWNPATQR